MRTIARVVATVPFGVIAVTLLFIVPPIQAQDGFRHIDENRPLRVEDAYPIKFKEWEWEVGVAGSIDDTGKGASSQLEIKTGVARNWEMGIAVHTGWERRGGISNGGIEAVGLHLLYNVNQEGRSAPAVAFRADVMSPGVGDAGLVRASGRFRGLATKTFGGIRLHGNATYTMLTPDDGSDYWSLGLAFDCPMALSSRAIMGDPYLEPGHDGEPAAVWLDVGSRTQVTKSIVLDLGLATRIDYWLDGRTNFALTLGVSRDFGFIGMVRVPPYQNPRIY
jgi:hypothetical protein